MDFYGKVGGDDRLEAYEAAGRIYGYHESEMPWLIDSARVLHRIVSKQDQIAWFIEMGKPSRLIRPEDFERGD